MTSKIIFEKTYDGSEDVVDLDRDISEMRDICNIPGEFLGTVKVLIWYEPSRYQQEKDAIQDKAIAAQKKFMNSVQGEIQDDRSVISRHLVPTNWWDQ